MPRAKHGARERGGAKRRTQPATSACGRGDGRHENERRKDRGNDADRSR
jgi:hypothetical protein